MTCSTCLLSHPDRPDDCAGARKAVMTALLTNIGDPGECRSCHRKIFWVTHRNGKKTPYTPEGLNHFVDCPAAKDFRK